MDDYDEMTPEETSSWMFEPPPRQVAAHHEHPPVHDQKTPFELMCETEYPVWSSLRDKERKIFIDYDHNRKKHERKQYPNFQRNLALEALIDAFFHVHDGHIPDNPKVVDCPSAYYLEYPIWPEFVAKMEMDPNGMDAISDLTGGYLRFPVIIRQTGRSYERDELMEWIERTGSMMDPGTRTPIVLSDIKSNEPLQEFLNAFERTRGFTTTRDGGNKRKRTGRHYKRAHVTRRCHSSKQSKKFKQSKKSKQSKQSKKSKNQL
jgi:hypothetical protein